MTIYLFWGGLKYILEKYILAVKFSRLGALRICIANLNIVRSLFLLTHFSCHNEFRCHIHNAGIALLGYLGGSRWRQCALKLDAERH